MFHARIIDESLKDHPASIIDFVDMILLQADLVRASDIHIDPEESSVRIRFRIDGNLVDSYSYPKHIHQEVVSRFKIMSRLKTDEHFLPQDGRFRLVHSQGPPLDMRISIMPAYHGECCVIRILKDRNEISSLSGLGLSDTDQSKIQASLKKSSGMILISGPTGSGKTTTLYTLLKLLNTPDTSIVTIEDPIEYTIPGIRQIQTNHHKGLHFATGLRSIVRQDPDVIMVGEIRDSETAKIAIHAAITGHLVLSTIHTTNAATTIIRLRDMGIESYLISAALTLVIAQRLIRRKSDTQTGRIGIYEAVPITDAFREAIITKSSLVTFQNLFKEHNISSLYDDGYKKYEQGLVSLEEVLSAVDES